MKLLKVAVENKRWDLAAHTIVLATAIILNNRHKTGTYNERSKEISVVNSTAKRMKKVRI